MTASNFSSEKFTKKHERFHHTSFCRFPDANTFVIVSKNPKISVIVPVYNAEKYLRQCMDSLVAQTLGDDMEIIAVNDGSTDGSSAMLRNYAEKDARIRLIEKPNAGSGHTFNTGMDHARGEYVGFLESDDSIAPEMFDSLYREAERFDKPDIVKSTFMEYFEDESKRQTVSMREDLPGRICRVDREPDILCEFSRPCHWSAIYRKEFLDREGIRFLETPGAAYQDTSFFAKTFLAAESIVFLDRAFYFYRQDNFASSIHSPRRERGEYHFVELDEVDRFLAARRDVGENVRRAWNLRSVRTLLSPIYHLRGKDKLDYLIRCSDRVQRLLNENDLDRNRIDDEEWKYIEYLASYDESGKRFTGPEPAKTLYEALAIPERRNIAIFGAGNFGRQLLRSFRTLGIHVEYLLDNDRELAGRIFEGVPIRIPERVVSERDRLTVVIGIANENACRRAAGQLEENGFSFKIISRIFRFDYYNLVFGAS